MITITPTLHVGTRAETKRAAHIALAYYDEPVDAANAIDRGERVVVPTAETAHAVLRARGIDPGTLPRWDDDDPDRLTGSADGDER
jgi:hypothetical protein